MAKVVDLNRDPGVEVTSGLPNTIKGFLPFQVQGLNFMKENDRCVYYQWDAGTGKTVAIEGTILWHKAQGIEFDVCLYMVKPNNFGGALKKLRQHTGLEPFVYHGTPEKRIKVLEQITQAMDNGEQPIVLMNAEKFRDDTRFMKILVQDASVLAIFDEMPSKFSNRTSGLFRGVCEVFYNSYVTPSWGARKGKKSFYPRFGYERTKKVFFVATSATPIYNNPEDFYNCTKIMDPRVFGSIEDFYTNHVASWDKYGNVAKWQNLGEMGEKAAHFVHQISKTEDPQIRGMFPIRKKPITEDCWLDDQSDILYRALAKEYEGITYSKMLDFEDILSAIGVLQLICSNPRAVLLSADAYDSYMREREEFIKELGSMKFTTLKKKLDAFDRKFKRGSEVASKLRAKVANDALFSDTDGHGNLTNSKLIKLREHLDNHEGKLIVFTELNDMMLPFIAEWLDEWGIPYVEFHGELSQKKRDAAIEAFRTDDDIKVFLSTDAGSDSIDLPEADLTVHYDCPWSDAIIIQRDNRQDRIDSLKKFVQVVSLRAPGTIEDRKLEVVMEKRGYYNQVFKGEIADQAEIIRKNKLLYILTGQDFDDEEG